LYDLQRGDIYSVKNEIALILQQEKFHINDMLKISEGVEILDFLIENEIVMEYLDGHCFPKINEHFNYPFDISNAIIDINHKSPDIIKSLDQLNSVFCKNILVRYFVQIDCKVLEDVIIYLDTIESIIQNVQFIIQFNSEYVENDYCQLLNSYPRINGIFIYSSPNSNILSSVTNSRGTLSYFQESFDSPHCCGVINENNFLSNIQFYSESKKYNTCLNKKISIDMLGNIKNCPSMNNILGHISKDLISDIIIKKDFLNYGKINKDQINICNVCQFRFACHDCRAYLENPDDLYSKPLKCGYNPILDQWTKWDDKKIKHEVIQLYKSRNNGF
jgi:SPASM domain peptide maturase of grasp-with-spasm system